MTRINSISACVLLSKGRNAVMIITPKTAASAKKFVAGFVFEIVAGDIPKRPWGGNRIFRTRMFEGDRMIVIICRGRASAFAHSGIERFVAACVIDCGRCWFHDFIALLLPVRCVVHPPWIQKFFST